jgi:[ribosomal protein S5]-alanine N-acetyltransferase
MRNIYKTNRLELMRLNLNDAEFIFELLNSEGWLKFIGDRNIKSTEDAQNYIQKIMDNPKINYWVVRSGDEKIGMISFIKRDYLDHHDLGFAFLPQFSGHGYAGEAAGKVLDDMLNDPYHKTILAIAMGENQNSIRLLEKLGFHFIKEIEPDGKKLLLYSIDGR